LNGRTGADYEDQVRRTIGFGNEALHAADANIIQSEAAGGAGKRPAGRRMRRIGILGGSFNPAHGGHRHISVLALKMLGLHEVWWMVSPQNPLKDAADMAPFDERMKAAKRVSRLPRIRVTDIERTVGTRYTVDTLNALVALYPNYRFVWLMGADNLVQISSWRGFETIFRTVPIAVFARPPYSSKALVGKAARVFARSRVDEKNVRRLALMTPPAWVFLHTPTHAGSATRIRRHETGGQGGR
jgi:nicotinate-nucleotide adenylyltransferase